MVVEGRLWYICHRDRQRSANCLTRDLLNRVLTRRGQMSPEGRRTNSRPPHVRSCAPPGAKPQSGAASGPREHPQTAPQVGPGPGTWRAGHKNGAKGPARLRNACHARAAHAQHLPSCCNAHISCASATTVAPRPEGCPLCFELNVALCCAYPPPKTPHCA